MVQLGAATQTDGMTGLPERVGVGGWGGSGLVSDVILMTSRCACFLFPLGSL